MAFDFTGSDLANIVVPDVAKQSLGAIGSSNTSVATYVTTNLPFWKTFFKDVLYYVQSYFPDIYPSGNLTVSNNFYVNGVSNFNGNIIVSGLSTFNNNVSIQSNVTVSGILNSSGLLVCAGYLPIDLLVMKPVPIYLDQVPIYDTVGLVQSKTTIGNIIANLTTPLSSTSTITASAFIGSGALLSGVTFPQAGVGPGGVLGGVRVDGNTIIISGAGVISSTGGGGSGTSTYVLPQASTTTLGGVKVDGTTITINLGTGIISGSSTYSLPPASTITLGGVKVDGTTITIDGSNIIHSSGGGGVSATSGTSFPGGPSFGSEVYRTDLDKWYKYNGTIWSEI